MKLFIRFFLSLCFLLLSGEGFMYADAYQESICYSPNKTFGKQGNASQSNEITPTINYSLPGKERRINKIFLTEDEDEDDDEVSFLKKYTKNSNYFTAFYGQTSQYSCNSTVTPSPVCDNFAYISDRYIVFRVIRI